MGLLSFHWLIEKRAANSIGFINGCVLSVSCPHIHTIFLNLYNEHKIQTHLYFINEKQMIFFFNYQKYGKTKVMKFNLAKQICTKKSFEGRKQKQFV